MTVNPSIFKAYDIRGIYPQDINEENISQIIKGIYTFFVKDLQKNKLGIALGRDMRLSSPSLFNKAKAALVNMGADVFDIGLVSTPTFYFAVLKYGYDAGIQISASHNPPQYNGIKFVRRDGNRLLKVGKGTGMEKVRENVLKQSFIASNKKGKVSENQKVVQDEIQSAFDTIKPKSIKPFKVVADPGNAMGILYLEKLFEKLPCKLIRMNFILDGTFPSHQPDPLEEKNVKDLEIKVKKEKADLGISTDGDADRIFFIDEKGKVVKASLITSLLAKDILKEYPGEKVLIDVRYVRNIWNAVKKSKGRPIVGKVGHALITTHMIREDVIFCGESSGHYFYRSTGYAESSVLTILRLLKILTEESKPLSQLIKEVQSSVESGEYNFVLKDINLSEGLLKNIANDYKDGTISLMDGLAVDFPSWRFSIRTSNTEPLLRLNIEGETKDLVENKLQELKSKILRSGAKEKH
ncbi:phosphomannomutase/phosphoglucomutase [Candidatus Roizmanbacteria bacterium]|nr:phosphomannomutase/phosphoglucomutase [Candidatus Roizmanbacteria bacterium]